MKTHAIVEVVLTNCPGTKTQQTAVRDDAHLQETLARYKASPQAKKITVFSPTTQYERVSAWVNTDPKV